MWAGHTGGGRRRPVDRRPGNPDGETSGPRDRRRRGSRPSLASVGRRAASARRREAPRSAANPPSAAPRRARRIRGNVGPAAWVRHCRARPRKNSPHTPDPMRAGTADAASTHRDAPTRREPTLVPATIAARRSANVRCLLRAAGRVPARRAPSAHGQTKNSSASDRFVLPGAGGSRNHVWALICCPIASGWPSANG